MEYVYGIETPEGIGKVAYGEFMAKDGRKDKFHCWWFGCGISGNFSHVVDAKEYLKKYIKELLTERKAGYEEKAKNLESYIKAMEAPCPCTIGTPCTYACSCANPVMSGGCDRCDKFKRAMEGSHDSTTKG